MKSAGPLSIEQTAEVWPIVASLLRASASPSTDGFSLLESMLADVKQSTGAREVLAVGQQGRQWQRVVSSSGTTRTGASTQPSDLPETLIAATLDAFSPCREAGWLAVPIGITADLSAASALAIAIPRVLLIQEPSVKPQEADRMAQLAAEVLATAGHLLLHLDRGKARIESLETLLGFAAKWHREDDPEALLVAIAGAATQVLNAERASIFLWDRPRRKLVGKPALGVDGQPLEVDDSAGVVGAVLQSGEPRRWQAVEDHESEINRTVDQQLKFVTRSLAAVPLEDQDGRPAGVFEVINKYEGAFDEQDVAMLTLLAQQAAGVIRSNQVRHTAIQSRDRMVDDAADGARIIGNCPAILALRETIQRVAATDLALLILGENGTGKEVLARSVHFQSPRRSEPFVAINCAALVETLLESELFGHEKGAFTDAHQTRVGKFELASGGTLFLDEIGDMSLGGQAKLLRVLEEKIIVRVGGSTPIPVDVRVIAATNQPLAEMVREKRFREDLYFRLNVVSLNLPPLRERGDDIVLLANHFLADFAKQIGRQPPEFAAEAVAALHRHGWAGNIRELRNLMERISYLCPDDTIRAIDLAFSADPRARTDRKADASAAQKLGLNEATRQFQIQAIEQAVAQCNGNMTDAAESLGLHRSNLYRKLKQLGMEP